MSAMGRLQTLRAAIGPNVGKGRLADLGSGPQQSFERVVCSHANKPDSQTLNGSAWWHQQAKHPNDKPCSHKCKAEREEPNHLTFVPAGANVRNGSFSDIGGNPTRNVRKVVFRRLVLLFQLRYRDPDVRHLRLHRWPKIPGHILRALAACARQNVSMCTRARHPKAARMVGESYEHVLLHRAFTLQFSEVDLHPTLRRAYNGGSSGQDVKKPKHGATTAG